MAIAVMIRATSASNSICILPMRLEHPGLQNRRECDVLLNAIIRGSGDPGIPNRLTRSLPVVQYLDTIQLGFQVDRTVLGHGRGRVVVQRSGVMSPGRPSIKWGSCDYAWSL
jgi:hypothetical protein